MTFIRMKNGDTIFSGHVTFLPSDEDVGLTVLNKINDKLKKLNKHYIFLPINAIGVYIGDPIIPEESSFQDEMALEVAKILKNTILNNVDHAVKSFNPIYVCYPDIVYKFNPSNWEYEYTIIPNSDIESIVSRTLADVGNV